MSLFDELYALAHSRHFAMLVSADHASGLLTISVMPRALNEADAKFCKDLTLTATPEEFDSGFIEAIGTYRSRLMPLLEQATEAAKAIDKTVENAKAAASCRPSNPTIPLNSSDPA